MPVDPWAEFNPQPVDPWAEFNPQPVASTGFPGVIQGAPDPYKQAAEQRAQEAAERASQSQNVQQANLDISQQRLAITQAEDSRKAEREARGLDATEGERKAAAFLIRALGSNESYEGTGLGPRGYVGQFARDNMPGVQNYLPSALGNSPARQVADSAQEEFIAASLRQDSGAAIPPEELERQREIYFPMPGDGPEAIEQKRQARLRALEGLKQSAGRLLDQTMQNYSTLRGQSDTATDADGLTGGNTYDPSEWDAAGNFIGGGSPGDPGGGTATNPPTEPQPGERSGLMALAEQGVTLGLADEAAGIGGFLSSFITGDDPGEAYVRDRDKVRARVDQARADNPVIGTALEMLGGGGALRVAGVGGNALREIASQGAGIGALGGFGYGEGAKGSVGNALGGAALGGALGAGMYGVGRGVGAIANRRAGPPPSAEQVALVEAGQRQGVPLRQPDVRPELRNRMSNAETGGTSGPLIRTARADDAAVVEQRVADVAGGGAAADPYALGNSVQGAGRGYIARTRQQAGRMYDRARAEAGGATVQPTEAVAALDNNITELRAAGENSNAGQIRYLEGLREDLSRPLSIEVVQNLRTNMRGQLSEAGLTGTDAERRVGQVIDAANADLVRDLPQGASSALRAADSFYRERQTFINDTLKQFMGSRGNPLPAETAASRLLSMTKGSGSHDRFSAMWRQLEPADQADIAATIAESLGRKRNGDFSLATLVQSLDPAKGINPRTARLVFGDEGAEALNDLRAIARAKTDTQASLNNSRTGVAVNAASGGLKSLLLGALGLSQGGFAGAIALPAIGSVVRTMGERRAARMLLNPDFTGWLRRAPNSSNPRVIDAYFSRLAGSGAAANDNQAFVAALRETFAQSPGRLAAREDESN